MPNVPLSSSGAAQTSLSLVTPTYWDDACKHLAKRDRVMRKLVADHGHARLYTKGDAFTTLARSIVGQQVSVKSAQGVWNKLLASFEVPEQDSRGTLTVNGVLSRPVEELRKVGLSARKVDYLCDLAAHFDNGQVHVADWQKMDDESIIEELTDIRGIGRWTAEMFLIFHLLRPNVLPLDDPGLIKAISDNYFSGEPVSRVEARDIAEAWAPYRTVGTWYLWRSLDPKNAA